MDVLTKEQRRKNMQAIRSKNTKIEVALARALWKGGFRYTKNNLKIFGRPDIAFPRYKIAIFCDSEYFHGKDWEILKYRIKSNKEFWHKKIEGNIRRDNEVNEWLRKEGWIVLRFWGDEIKKNTELCLVKIKNVILEQKAILNSKAVKNADSQQRLTQN